MSEEQVWSLSPINFFQLQCNCLYLPPAPFPSFTAKNCRKYLLPNTAALCAEEPFANTAIGWNHEGIEIFVVTQLESVQPQYPNIMRGDSVEIFIDTRDVKTSGFNTRFCHHFFFLPEAVEGTIAGEITKFRTEDVHELCNATDLKITTIRNRSGYQMNIFIPSECLHGYDPEQIKRLGFTYRINRSRGMPQHFSVTSGEYQIEQQPSLWSTLNLIVKDKD